jgi:hypothetical protein
LQRSWPALSPALQRQLSAAPSHSCASSRWRRAKISRLKGHRVLKTARIVASGLTAFIAPVLIAAIVLTLLKI